MQIEPELRVSQEIEGGGARGLNPRPSPCQSPRKPRQPTATKASFWSIYSHSPLWWLFLFPKSSSLRAPSRFRPLDHCHVLTCTIFLLLYLALTLVRCQMAWLEIFFIYMDTQEHTISRVWIHFIPTSLYSRREEKHLVWAGIESRSSCFSSNCSNH